MVRAKRFTYPFDEPRLARSEFPPQRNDISALEPLSKGTRQLECLLF